MINTFDCAISLGPVCKTGYQIRRVFGRGRCLPSIFDKQITPPKTIALAFETNFVGMFERQDFSESAPIVHRRLGVTTMHGFRSPHDYSAMRREHDGQVWAMRRALRSQRRILFVGTGFDQSDLELIRDAISLRRDGRPFHIVNVHDAGTSQHWRGNDEVWDQNLSSYSVESSIEARVLGSQLYRRAQKHWRLPL